MGLEWCKPPLDLLLQSLFVHRMKNPHLRAKLAEVLEAVMPHMEPVAPGAVQPIVFQRERVFCSYRHAPQLAEALIAVFVDIEFTGVVFLIGFDSLLLLVDGSCIELLNYKSTFRLLNRCCNKYALLEGLKRT